MEKTSAIRSLSSIFEMSILSASPRLLFSRLNDRSAIKRHMITTINFLDKKIPHIYFFKSICEGSFFITFNYFLLPERMNQNEPERKIDEKRPAIIPTIMGSAKF